MTLKHELPPVSPALADVAQCDAATACSAAGIGMSTFHDGVRRTARGELRPGEVPYPQPVIRGPKFTRWRLADVRAWLIARAETGDGADTEGLELKVKRATAAATLKRRADSRQSQGVA